MTTPGVTMSDGGGVTKNDDGGSLTLTDYKSGGKSKTGHITRQSRRLTRTLFTQSIMHFADASPYLRLYYSNMISRRGVGRARIALIRKICGMMRRMLLEQEKFRWMQPSNFERKLKRYECQMKKIKKIKEEKRKIA